MKRKTRNFMIISNSIVVVLFFMWSKLVIVSIVLFIIIDSFSINYIAKFLKNKLKKGVYKIIKYSYIISLPILIAIFIRTFLFDIYFVPSSSMERTLYPNDYVIVNKVSYGVKLPKHARNVPVVGNLFSAPKNQFDLYRSLPSTNKFKREDIVVFKAVDDSDKFLIKRIIGMPLDTLRIVDSKVFVNSEILPEKENYTHKYVWKNKNRVSIFNSFSNKEYTQLSKSEKQHYKRDVRKEPSFTYSLFPPEKQDVWTRDNYGDIIIPQKGMSILLNNENIDIYRSILQKFEGVNFSLKEHESKRYVFKSNYYFLLGDNRHNSLDSRSFGFVPESYIQGKMIKVFSKKRLLED